MDNCSLENAQTDVEICVWVSWVRVGGRGGEEESVSLGNAS